MVSNLYPTLYSVLWRSCPKGAAPPEERTAMIGCRLTPGLTSWRPLTPLSSLLAPLCCLLAPLSAQAGPLWVRGEEAAAGRRVRTMRTGQTCPGLQRMPGREPGWESSANPSRDWSWCCPGSRPIRSSASSTPWGWPWPTSTTSTPSWWRRTPTARRSPGPPSVWRGTGRTTSLPVSRPGWWRSRWGTRTTTTRWTPHFLTILSRGEEKLVIWRLVVHHFTPKRNGVTRLFAADDGGVPHHQPCQSRQRVGLLALDGKKLRATEIAGGQSW